MTKTTDTIDHYLSTLPEDRQLAMGKLRSTLLQHLPSGFEEVMAHGMIAYVVPHHLFPSGYHANPKQPLPFISFGSQKNCISFHHLGIYGNAELRDWFTDAYAKQVNSKLDMGKGCIRFKKMDEIPHKLMAELAEKISPAKWIELYLRAFTKK